MNDMCVKHGRLARVAVRRLVALTFLALSMFSVLAQSEELVVVDLDDLKGPAGDPIASGFRGTWADDIPDSLLSPLKPSCVTGPSFWPETTRLWRKAADAEAVVHILVTATLPREDGGDTTDIRWIWDADPGPDSLTALMSQWKGHVGTWVAVAEARRVLGEDTVDVIYEIWNEPDTRGEWDPDSSFGDPVALFLQVWEAAYDTIRAAVPTATIAGPSFAYSVKGADPTHVNASGVQMDRFLMFCDSKRCLPDVVGWHDVGNSDFADPNMYDEAFAADSTWNLYAQVDYADSLLDTLVVNGPRPTQFEINEMMHSRFNVIPGVIVREFALAERARERGLLLAGRTHWCDPCLGPPCDPNDVSRTSKTRLANLVYPCDGDSLWLKRSAWWTYKAYADMEGMFVGVSSPDSLDGLAGFDRSREEVRILLGRYAATDRDDVRLVVRNIEPGWVGNDAMRIRIARISGHPDSVFMGGVTPIQVSERNRFVDEGSLLIDIGSADFGPGDALEIVVYRSRNADPPSGSR